MVNVYCDVCKKKIDNPMTDTTIFYYADYSVCETCKDNLEYQLKPQIRGREPFSMDWYRKLLTDAFTKAVQRGRS
jgi:hypothetical protein